mmetsp:Transcript_5700/g.17190  ORF Transcript_5700/g.17190 Transcript_5700/m.17190 type:complete len:276 (+) Transcript_5700:206-1033(+)
MRATATQRRRPARAMARVAAATPTSESRGSNARTSTSTSATRSSQPAGSRRPRQKWRMGTERPVARLTRASPATQAMICDMLRSLPLEPATAMALIEFFSEISFWTLTPASERDLLRTLLTEASKDSITVRPGCMISSPFWPLWTRSRTLVRASFMMSSMKRIVSWSATVSAMPTEKEVLTIQWLTRHWVRFRKSRATSGPRSSQTVWTRPPAEVPRPFLSRTPSRSWPEWTRTVPSALFGVPSASSWGRYLKVEEEEPEASCSLGLLRRLLRPW